MLFKIENYVNGKVFSISLKIVKFKTRKNTRKGTREEKRNY